MGRLRDLQKANFRRAINNTGHDITVVLSVNPSSQITATSVSVKAFEVHHHLSVDTDGQFVQGRQKEITVIIADVDETSYPWRNFGGEIALKSTHQITIDGVLWAVRDFMPDLSLGIVLITLAKLN